METGIQTLLDTLFPMPGVCAALLDRTFRYLRVTPAYAEPLGKTPEELVGVDHFELEPRLGDEGCELIALRGDDRELEGLLLLWPAADRPHPAGDPPDCTGEVTGPRPAERIRHLEFLLQREIAERHRDHARLAEVAQAWTATLDAMDDLISVNDRDYTIVRANKAFASFVGKSCRDLVGEKCYELLHGTTEPWDGCPHRESCETKSVVSREVSDPSLDRSFLVTCYPFTDGSGHLVGSVHVLRDISEEKQAREEREGLIAQLQQALAQTRLLQGLLPICASCKKIRDDQGYWNQIEEYIRDHSDAEFTHSICPECVERLYPELRRG